MALRRSRQSERKRGRDIDSHTFSVDFRKKSHQGEKMFPAYDQQRFRKYLTNTREPCVAIFEIGTRAVRLLVAPKIVPGAWAASTFCGDSGMANLGFDVGFLDAKMPIEATSLKRTIEFVCSRSDFLRNLGVTEFTVIGTAWLRWLENANEVTSHIASQTG